MKKILIKALSFVLCSILLVGAVYTVPTLAATEGNATLTPKGMIYSHSDGKISGSTHNGVVRALGTNYCAVYGITLESDKPFDPSVYDTSFTRGGVFYNTNLGLGESTKLDYANVYTIDGSTQHDELAKLLRENIYINGISISEAISNNLYTAASLLVGINENKIFIIVPVGLYNAAACRKNTDLNFNNPTHGFYVGDFSVSSPSAVDYTISIGDGIKIGDVAINPMSYRFNASNESNSNTGTFSEFVDAGNNATLTPTRMTYAHTHSSISGNGNGLFKTVWNNFGAAYAITLESDTTFDSSAYDIDFNDRASTKYNTNYEYVGKLDYAYLYSSEAAAAHDAFANMLRNNIYINGKSIAEAIADNKYNKNYTVFVGILSNKITIMIPVAFFATDESKTNLVKDFNNTECGFYVGDFSVSSPSAVDYTISIGDGIKIGDVAINPMSYRFNASNESNAKTGSFNEIKIDVMGASVDTKAIGDIRFEINADFDTYATYGIEEVGVIMIPTAFVTNGDKTISLNANYYKGMKPAIKKFTADEVSGTDQIFATLKNSSNKAIRIRTDISARAYIKFTDGTIIYSRNNDYSRGIINGTSSRSCIDVIRAIASQNKISGVEDIVTMPYIKWNENESTDDFIDHYKNVIDTINQQLYGS